MPVECQLSASRAPVEDLSNYGLPAIIFQTKIVCIHLGYEFRVGTLFFSVLGVFLVFFLEILCQLECQLSASRVPVCVPAGLAPDWHSTGTVTGTKSLKNAKKDPNTAKNYSDHLKFIPK